MPLFASSAQAAAHALRDISHPGPRARVAIAKTERTRVRLSVRSTGHALPEGADELQPRDPDSSGRTLASPAPSTCLEPAPHPGAGR